MNCHLLPVGLHPTNCYVVWAEDGSCAVVDSGDEPKKIIRFLQEKNLTPTHILLTHGHYDHIGGVKGLQGAYGCTLCIGRNDAEMLEDDCKSLAYSQNDADTYILKADQTVQEGDVVQVGSISLQVLETPGHTKGGVCYQTEDLLFCGDTLFREECGRTDLYGGSWEKMQQSLARLMCLPADTKVLPGHGPSSTIGHEKQFNPYTKE